MPAKRSSSRTPAKSKPVKAAPASAETRRSRRGASPSPAHVKAGSKRKASPSPAPAKSAPGKKGRRESASPAPTKKLPTRGRSASALTKKEETPTKGASKSRSTSKSKDNQKQTRVTRAVVEEVEKRSTSARERSTSKQKTIPTPHRKEKKETPKRNATPKQPPKQTVATSKKKTPAAKAASRGRSGTPKSQQKVITPKKKETPKQTPKSKQRTQKTTPAVSKKKQTASKQKALKAKLPAKKRTTVRKASTKKPKTGPEIAEPSDDIGKEEIQSKHDPEPIHSDDNESFEEKGDNEEFDSQNENRGEFAKSENDGKKAHLQDKADTQSANSDDANVKDSEFPQKDETEPMYEKCIEYEPSIKDTEPKRSFGNENLEEEIKENDTAAPNESEDSREDCRLEGTGEKFENTKENDNPEADVDESSETAVSAEASLEGNEIEGTLGEIEESDVAELKTVKEDIELKVYAGEKDNEKEESAEAVKDETLVQEDENVEEDQELSKVSQDFSVHSVQTKVDTTQNQADQDERIESTEEDAIEPQTEVVMLEHQAESEQVEPDEKEECESAESEQVEADVTCPEVVEISNSPKEPSKTIETIEVDSDESSKDGAHIVEISEGSCDADVVEEIIEDNSKEAGATGGGDAHFEQIDKEEYGAQEIGVSPVPVAEAKNVGQQKKGISCAEEEKAAGAVEVLEVENTVNSAISNGATVENGSLRKRKLDETQESPEELPSKKAKSSVEEEQIENGSLLHENDVSGNYVFVEMSQVPPADSEEVKDCFPRETVLQSDVNENPVYSRVFIPNPGFNSSGDHAKQFSIVSYNILADCHLFRNDYSFTDGQYLIPEYRLASLLKELEYLDGDIVCLQEVDPNFFKQSLLPRMKSLGYEGIHKKRTTEYFDEGEATFYKLGRFSLVDFSTCRLADLVEKELVDGIDPAVQNAVRQYMDLPDVLVVTKLRCNKTGLEVTVGNIHVNWGEMKTPDAQCVQIASAIKEIVSKAGLDNLPHLICGDFNSPPFSPGYLVAKDGYPTGDETVTKLQEIAGLKLPDEKTSSLVNSLWPAFQHTSFLISAYKEVEGSEPQITSYNRVMKDTVDYVFYSSASLDNVGVLRTASQDRITETGGIPNQFFPSDHVSLKVVLSFK